MEKSEIITYVMIAASIIVVFLLIMAVGQKSEEEDIEKELELKEEFLKEDILEDILDIENELAEVEELAE